MIEVWSAGHAKAPSRCALGLPIINEVSARTRPSLYNFLNLKSGLPDEARLADNPNKTAGKKKARHRSVENLGGRSRGEKIRTSDPHVPNVVR